MFDYTSCAQTLTALKIDYVRYDGGSVLIIPNKEISAEKVVGNFEFRIDSMAKEVDEFGGWSAGQEEGREASFALNYNPETNVSIRPLVRILATNQGYVGCADCYAKGKIRYGAVFKGKRLRVESYSFFVNGSIDANMNIELESYQGTERMVGKQSVVGMAFALVGSPGLFALQSSVNLNAAVDVRTPPQSIKATVGFDASIPFNVTITSEGGLFSRPEYTGSFRPEINYHPFNSTQVKISAEARMVPLVDFGFAVLGKKIGYGLDLDTGIGSELVFGHPGCPLALTLEMYEFGSANLRSGGVFRNSTRTLVELAKTQIKCATCRVCPKSFQLPPSNHSTLRTSTVELIPMPTSLLDPNDNEIKPRTKPEEIMTPLATSTAVIADQATTTKTRRPKRSKVPTTTETTTSVVENINRPKHLPSHNPAAPKITKLVEQKTKVVNKEQTVTKAMSGIHSKAKATETSIVAETKSKVEKHTKAIPVEPKEVTATEPATKSKAEVHTKAVPVHSEAITTTGSVKAIETWIKSSAPATTTINSTTAETTLLIYSSTGIVESSTNAAPAEYTTDITSALTFETITYASVSEQTGTSYISQNAYTEISVTSEAITVTANYGEISTTPALSPTPKNYNRDPPYAPNEFETLLPESPYVPISKPAPISNPYSPPLDETPSSPEISTPAPTKYAESSPGSPYQQVNPSSAQSVTGILAMLCLLLV